MFNSWIPYRSNTQPIGDVLRQNQGVDTAIGTLLNVDKSRYTRWTGYQLFTYATSDVISKQFKMPANVNQLSKLELYPTSNIKNAQPGITPLAAKIKQQK